MSVYPSKSYIEIMLPAFKVMILVGEALEAIRS